MKQIQAQKRIKYKFLLIITTIILFTTLNPVYAKADSYNLYLGGFPAGFVLNNSGAIVVGVNNVVCPDNVSSPAKAVDIRVGDIIISLDGKKVNTSYDIENVLEYYDGEGITAVIDRNGEILLKTLFPQKDIMGKYKMGLFIKNDITGIGTITCFDSNGNFAALGHPVVDATYQRTLKINDGFVYDCTITGVNRGEKGRAGEVKGYFDETLKRGKITRNSNNGLFGKYESIDFINNKLKYEVTNATPGKAKIFTTISEAPPKFYDINIVKVNESEIDNKDLVIKITDEELISKTGGILQGMSGSPIIQNDKLVGAVTHVFVNDHTRGYGITIKKMIIE